MTECFVMCDSTPSAYMTHWSMCVLCSRGLYIACFLFNCSLHIVIPVIRSLSLLFVFPHVIKLLYSLMWRQRHLTALWQLSYDSVYPRAQYSPHVNCVLFYILWRQKTILYTASWQCHPHMCSVVLRRCIYAHKSMISIGGDGRIVYFTFSSCQRTVLNKLCLNTICILFGIIKMTSLFI